MKLFRYGDKGREIPGMVLRDGTWIDVSIFGEDFDENFFGSRGLKRLARWAATFGPSQPKVDPREVRLGPPIARPSKLVCIGLNYRDHAEEARMALPEEPVIFLKATSAICGPFDDLVLPKGAAKVDWEVELGVVIGQTTREVSEQRAADSIAGFLVVNDVSERTYQLERGGQWVKGKSLDGFAPLGPLMVTPGDVGNYHDLKLGLTLNGKAMQDSTTAHMIFSIPRLVSYVSHFMTLLPGDVISTGTPSGVGFARRPPRFLKSGDVIEAGIERLGNQHQRVVARER